MAWPFFLCGARPFVVTLMVVLVFFWPLFLESYWGNYAMMSGSRCSDTKNLCDYEATHSNMGDEWSYKYSQFESQVANGTAQMEALEFCTHDALSCGVKSHGGLRGWIGFAAVMWVFVFFVFAIGLAVYFVLHTLMLVNDVKASKKGKVVEMSNLNPKDTDNVEG